MFLSRVNSLTINDMVTVRSRQRQKNKKGGGEGRGQQSDHRTRLWKASAVVADTVSGCSEFHTLMVRGKKELSRISFLLCSLQNCRLCARLDLTGAGCSSTHFTLTVPLLILYRVVSLAAFLLFSRDGHFRVFNMSVTLLVL